MDPELSKHSEQMEAIAAGFERLKAKYAAIGDPAGAADGGRAEGLRAFDAAHPAAANVLERGPPPPPDGRHHQPQPQ